MTSETEAPSVQAECNVFAIHPSGFRIHVKLLDPNAAKILSRLETLLTTMVERKYKPDNTNSRSTATEARRSPATKAKKRSKAVDVPDCEYCGGPVWDNRQDKRSAKSPDFKCKDRDNCGAAAWVQDDGQLSWVEG
jgi:hypothetical protein